MSLDYCIGPTICDEDGNPTLERDEEKICPHWKGLSFDPPCDLEAQGKEKECNYYDMRIGSRD